MSSSLQFAGGHDCLSWPTKTRQHGGINVPAFSISSFLSWQPAKPRTGVSIIWIYFQQFQFGNYSGYGDGSSLISFRVPSPTHIPVRCNGSVLARKMHSATNFAVTVLRDCVCVSWIWAMSYVVNHPILIPACNKYTVFKIGSDITIVYIYTVTPFTVNMWRAGQTARPLYLNVVYRKV